MKADAELDISKETCPMTFVRTKVKLETMQGGELLRVTLRDGEPLVNVPRAVLDHGHSVLATEPLADQLYALWIRVKS
jgi:tRNA 2-thiouridine synthesizing protein A